MRTTAYLVTEPGGNFVADEVDIDEAIDRSRGGRRGAERAVGETEELERHAHSVARRAVARKREPLADRR